MSWQRRVLAVAFSGALVSACEPKVVEVTVQIITTSCESPPTLEGVTHLKVRVLAEDLSAPLEAVSSVAAAPRQLTVPQIPAGKNRMVEVRAYAGEPQAGGKVVSIGRSPPFDVPEVVSPSARPREVTVFLRRTGLMTPPSSLLAPASCSRMFFPRVAHTATLLANGKVLIAGGFSLKNGKLEALSKAELFNPETGSFEEAPSMGVSNDEGTVTELGRGMHSATLLKNNQVLVWGGAIIDRNQALVPVAGVLLYDQDQNEWGGVPKVAGKARVGHGAVRDYAGRVLIVGGETWATDKLVPEPSVEWYDPETASGAVVPGLSFPRKGASALAVQGGRYVAVAGGADGAALTSEITFFSFEGGAFRPLAGAPKLKVPRRSAGAALLRQGNDLLLAGGFTDPTGPSSANSSEIITTKDAFGVSEGPVVTPRGAPCAAALPDGRVVTIGGLTPDKLDPTKSNSDGTVEILAPQPDGKISVLGKPALKLPRAHHSCTPLPDGSVLILGGASVKGDRIEATLQDALIFTPEPLEP